MPTGLALTMAKFFPEVFVNSNVRTYAAPEVSVRFAVAVQFGVIVNVPVCDRDLVPVPEATVALAVMVFVPLIVMIPRILKTLEIVVDVSAKPEPAKEYVPARKVVGQVAGRLLPLMISAYVASWPVRR